ncbi:MAG: DUF3604 domain-containing protein, partial [Limnobacter sp.]|nr:DUF3604 domain-containing protein [Limnobacter sp.]
MKINWKKLGIGVVIFWAVVSVLISIEHSLYPTERDQKGEPAASQIAPDRKEVNAQRQTEVRQDLQVKSDKQILFGDLHVHTAYSTDAYAFDTRVEPDEAYRYARGGSVLLPPLNGDGMGTRLLSNERPLDFMAVTDHAEYMGEGSLCIDPAQDAYDTLVCKVYRGDLSLPVGETMQPLIRMLSMVIHGKERP